MHVDFYVKCSVSWFDFNESCNGSTFSHTISRYQMLRRIARRFRIIHVRADGHSAVRTGDPQGCEGAPKRQVHHSLTSGFEVKNEWSCALMAAQE